MHLSEILTHLGEDRENYFNAVAPPIIQTSNFTFPDFAALKGAFDNEMSAYLYTRGVNPTVDILRKKMAALDGAEDALILNSGASAIYCAVMSNVQAGDHVISVEKPYTWAWKLFDTILPRYGISTSYVDGTKIENFEAAIRPNTKVIYLESPNTLTFELQDLQAVAALAKHKGIVTIIDNSYCTPIYQQPIKLGIDIAIQSATKYIGGHSDTVGGVLTGSKAMIKQIFDREALNTGAFISPMNAWLLLRGLRTLKIRLQYITNSTKVLLSFLAKHHKVEKVWFPMGENAPQQNLANQQMSGACGLLSIALNVRSYEQIETFCKTLKCFLLAVSWGGHESLIMPQAAAIGKENFDPAIQKHRMIRLYIGLEDPEYLIEDLTKAFETI